MLAKLYLALDTKACNLPTATDFSNNPRLIDEYLLNLRCF